MREYKVVFAPTAQEDLEHVVAWLNEQAPEKISEWIMSLRADIDTLQLMPERCPLAPENGLWGEEELRQLLFQQYPWFFVDFYGERASFPQKKRILVR